MKTGELQRRSGDGHTGACKPHCASCKGRPGCTPSRAAQVKKEEEELNRAFGSSGATVMGVQKPGAPRPGATAADLAEKKMVTVMLFGNVHECEVAQRMIAEAIDNKACTR